MNISKLICCLLLFTAANTFSQGYYGQRNYTTNRDMMRFNNQPSAEEIEKSKTERIEKFVAKLKEGLQLDDLQVIAIRNELFSNSKNVDIVIKKENSEEEKSKEVKALMDQSESRIISYLNSSQKEKYNVLMEELKKNKGDKKNKKDKKHKDEDAKPIEE